MTTVPPTAAVLGSLALLMSVTSCGRAPAPATLPTLAVPIAGKTFHLEVAATPAARYQGLSDRASLAGDSGMLFAFPDAAPRTFVMRRCLIPLDIVFLSPALRIVGLHRMAVQPPGTPEDRLTYYESQWPAQYAIELPTGSIGTLGLTDGQKIDLPLDTLKPR
jgi:uncharacterized protein